MKKIFLTSMIAMCMACPAFATDESIDDGDMCTYSELGTYDGTANIEAIWEANTYSENPGYYLLFENNTITQNVICPANSVCPGFTNQTFADQSMIIDTCTNTAGASYPYSAQGTSTSDMCYNTTTITCSTYNPLTVENGTVTYANASTNAKIYKWLNQTVLDSSLACAATVTCDNGYTATAKGALADYVHTGSIKDESHVRFKDVDGTTVYGTNANSLTAGQWEVTYLDGTKISGMASCNNVSFQVPSATIPTQPNSAIDSQTATGGYCWCNMTGYTLNGAQSGVNTTSVWVARTINMGGYAECSSRCAVRCAEGVVQASLTDWHKALFSGNADYPECNANTIALKWYNENTEFVPTNNDAKQCTYDEEIVLPETDPEKTGYTFGGWRFRSSTPASNNN